MSGFDAGVRANLPIDVAEGDGRSTDGHLPGQELVVGDGVGGEVRDIAVAERPAFFGLGGFEDAKAGAPVVAYLLDAAHLFGEDGVGRDAAVDEGPTVARDQGGDARGQEPEISEDVGGELDVGGRPPCPGVIGQGEDDHRGQRRNETSPDSSQEITPSRPAAV